jgi:hypothetical protein
MEFEENVDDTEPMIGYYLGDPIEILGDYGDGWVGARFIADVEKSKKKGKEARVWRMWYDQIKSTPWGETP